MRNELVVAVPILLLSWPTPAAAGQGSPPAAPAAGFTREIGFHAGVSLAPPVIGRDVNRAGGDVLLAELGDSAISGLRFGWHKRFVGVALNLVGWLEPVAVENEAGVQFPHHGEPPGLYLLEARLYPLGESAGTRLSPYVAAGVGGALISVDLDNVEDQETRHLWARSWGGGVKLAFNEGQTFLDLQLTVCSLSGRGPIAAFRIRAVTIGFGMRY